MTGRPQTDEAAPRYFTYIDKVAGDDILGTLESQLDESLTLFRGISEERSLHRYAPDKWSIRQVLSHVSDTERAFAYRALWFARGFQEPLLSFDQTTAAAGAQADTLAWAAHVEDFRRVRLASISLFRNMPEPAWLKRGVVSSYPFTVRALAFIAAGHAAHHLNILRTRYA